ncbi:MAG: hypothetical protein HYT27_01020 [Parcubacteria group bacterium]|nr:hypothetical protein [Parcubacteria group bacterium]
MNFLMCKPTFFDVTEKDQYGNEHMDPNNRPNKKWALSEWEDLVRIYEMLGVNIHFIEPVPGLVDMTFTANCGITFIEPIRKRKTILLSKFRPARRRTETVHFEHYFRAVLHYDTTRTWNEYYFEGAGDVIPFGDSLLAGYGFRTSKEMMSELHSVTGKKIIPLELKKPDTGDKILYHLDTTMIVMDTPTRPTIIVFKGAFTDESYTRLTQEVQRQSGRLLEAEYEDAAGLALNAVVLERRQIALSESCSRETKTLTKHYAQIKSLLKDTNRVCNGVIVTSDTASNHLLRSIEECGYYPITTPLGEFRSSVK